MNTIKIIYITVSSQEEAQKIVCDLLEKKLIACANFFPVGSMYIWEEVLEQAQEYVLIAKTTENKFIEVKEAIEKIHSYVVPCIIGISCHVNDSFFDFIQKSVS